MLHNLLHLSPIQSLILQQGRRNEFHLCPVFLQNLFCPLMGPVDDLMHFLINLSCRLLAVSPRPANIPTQENIILMIPIFDHPHTTTHSPLTNHLLRIPRGHLNVPTGTAGDIPQKHFLGHSPPHRNTKVIQHLFLSIPIPIFNRQHHRHP